MKKFTFYVGIDVSKSWLDIAVLAPSTGVVLEKRIDNNVRQIRAFLKDMEKQCHVALDEVLFCLEHTGKYGYPFLEVAAMKKAKVWVESAIQIKRSQGLVRGKTDRWDAKRIAEYAYRFSDKARFFEPLDQSLHQLKDYQIKRDLLVKTYTQLTQENRKDPLFDKPLKAIKNAIEDIEQKIEALLKGNLTFLRQYQLLLSISGIGRQTAIALILATEGFSRLTDARKLSCFAGVATFPFRSGSSIKGNARVSKMGNMKLKTLLNMCAWNAIRSTGDIKNYYERKLAEGKHKLSIINAVKNKLLATAIAVIKRDSPFTKHSSGIIS